jgi:hypothetical protein
VAKLSEEVSEDFDHGRLVVDDQNALGHLRSI